MHLYSTSRCPACSGVMLIDAKGTLFMCPHCGFGCNAQGEYGIAKELLAHCQCKTIEELSHSVATMACEDEVGPSLEKSAIKEIRRKSFLANQLVFGKTFNGEEYYTFTTDIDRYPMVWNRETKQLLSYNDAQASWDGVHVTTGENSSSMRDAWEAVSVTIHPDSVHRLDILFLQSTFPLEAFNAHKTATLTQTMLLSDDIPEDERAAIKAYCSSKGEKREVTRGGGEELVGVLDVKREFVIVPAYEHYSFTITLV